MCSTNALRSAGVVHSSKSGRVVTHRLDPSVLQPLSEWLLRRQTFWAQQLDHLTDDLETS
ncbi:hypothetical protein [Luteipulveratus halotolerans]|uniref:hypothetical protein n=1 Tax=Luteipulveratus halotolerans TaxID=1631356 RepID=UPI000681E6F1|nr:hypothetical protein [Luteipulveratus halotolerans]